MHYPEPELSSLIVDLAERPSELSLARILDTVRAHLGMEVAFISEFVDGRRVFRQVEAAVATPVKPGGSDPLADSYCQRVIDGRLPQLIPDTAAEAEAMALPVTTALPVGSHISVPILLPDGGIYGTFCCFSATADHSLDDRDLRVMRAFADLAAFEIDRSRAASRDRGEKVARISGAIDRQEFGTVFQPILRLDERRVIAFECLTRFHAAPQRTPDVWFAEAAETGLGVALEVATMRKALSALPAFPAEVALSVNVSPAVVVSDQFAALFAEAPLDRLVLEITEHAQVADYGSLHQALTPLRRRGLQLAIDDAGAGYASLRHILAFAPDIIKLDISLIHDLDRDPARQALTAALIAFANETGSTITAEGVETPGELEALRRIGIRRAQGYLLGRPLALDDAAALLV